MERAPNKPEGTCEVMAFDTLHGRASIVKISPISWIVFLQERSNPHLGKAIWCISFEQASHIFSGCEEKLKVWKN